MATENARRKLAEMLRDESASPQDRGDMFLYALGENGLEHRETLQEIIAQADLGRTLQDRMEAVTRHSLASERFLGSYHVSPQLALRHRHERPAGHVPADHLRGTRQLPPR